MIKSIKSFFIGLIDELQFRIETILVAINMMSSRVADIKDTVVKINKKLDDIEEAVKKPVKSGDKDDSVVE